MLKDNYERRFLHPAEVRSAIMQWDIRREGRAWSDDEFPARWALTPEKYEVWDGKMLWTDEDRLNLLALLLENVGIDAALRLAPKEVWREALDAYEHE